MLANLEKNNSASERWREPMGATKAALPSSGPKGNHTRRGENGKCRREGKEREGRKVHLLLGACRGGGLECAYPKGLCVEHLSLSLPLWFLRMTLTTVTFKLEMFYLLLTCNVSP